MLGQKPVTFQKNVSRYIMVWQWHMLMVIFHKNLPNRRGRCWGVGQHSRQQPISFFAKLFSQIQSYQIIYTEVAKRFQKMPKSEFWQRNGPHFSNLAKIAQNFCKLAGKQPTFLAFFGEKSPLLVTLHRLHMVVIKKSFASLERPEIFRNRTRQPTTLYLNACESWLESYYV